MEFTNDVFQSLKSVILLANSVNMDEMPHVLAFHLGFHCLSRKGLQKGEWIYNYVWPINSEKI